MYILIGAIVGIVVLGVIVAVVIAGLQANSRQDDESDPLMTRLAEATQRGEVVQSIEEIELQQPFSQRVIIPFLRRVGEFAVRWTPQRAIEDANRKIELAGNPYRMDAATYLAARIIAPVVFIGFFILLDIFSPSKFSALQMTLIIIVFGFIGNFFPYLLLQSRINARQSDVRKAMPDALDLLTICVEAGLGFEAAMSKVSEKWQNELSLAFLRVIREIQLGKARRDALRDMADRIGIPELTSFVAAVIQSEMLGVSLSKVLRIQSDQMRVKRRQRAEEQAHQAPVKMILPLGLLIFPSIFIILLTPAAIQISKTFGQMNK